MNEFRFRFLIAQLFLLDKKECKFTPFQLARWAEQEIDFTFYKVQSEFEEWLSINKIKEKAMIGWER